MESELPSLELFNAPVEKGSTIIDGHYLEYPIDMDEKEISLIRMLIKDYKFVPIGFGTIVLFSKFACVKYKKITITRYSNKMYTIRYNNIFTRTIDKMTTDDIKFAQFMMNFNTIKQ